MKRNSRINNISIPVIQRASIMLLLFVIAMGMNHTTFAQTFCRGESASLDAGMTYTGTIQWQFSANGTTYNDIPGSTSDPYAYAVDESGYLRAMITSGTCQPFFSDTIMITVNSTSDTLSESGNAAFQLNFFTDADTIAGGGVALESSGVFSTGTGADGIYNTTGNTSLPAGTYNYTDFTINAGHTIQVTGSTQPLVIFATGTVTINGTLDLSGQPGANSDNNTPPGIGGAGGGGGGFPGGSGGDGNPPATSTTYHGIDGQGPGGGIHGITEFITANDGQGGGGGSYGTVGGSSFQAGGGGGIGGSVYGSVLVTPLVGGSGGGGGAGDDDGGGGSSDGGGGGGGGGGAVRITATTINVGGTGTIKANGGNGGSCGNGGSGGGGSGGAIFLEGNSINNSGLITATGGSSLTDQYANSIGGTGGDGRIRADYVGLNNTGSITPAVGHAGSPGSSSFKPSGSMLTNILIPAATFCSWGIVDVIADTSISGTSISIDVLDATGTSTLAAGIAPGTDLLTIPAVATAASIRLKFNLTTTNTSATPFLYGWTIEYYKL